MKKAVALILAVVFAMSLTACGGSETASDGGVPTLTWYVHGDAQHDVGTVMEEVNKITEAKIGAKLDLQFIDQPSYTEKMSMMMAAGTEFDICFTGYVNTYRNVAKRGGLLALDDYLKEMPELWNSIPEVAWDTTRMDNTIYAIPNLQIIGNQLNFYTFKDLADKYGLSDKLEPLAEIDYETIETYLKQIRDNESSYYPVRFDYGTTVFTTNDMRKAHNIPLYSHSIGGTGINVIFDENGEFIDFTTGYTTEGEMWAYETAREWYKEGLIREDILSVTNDAAEQAAGKYASWMEKYKPGLLQELEQKHGKEVVCYKVTNNLYMSTAPDAMTGISKTTKYPELALKMVELVNTDKELYNLICFGVEGKHYNLDENGRVVYNDEGGYKPKACWKFGNQFNALLLPGQPETVWEDTRAMNENAVPSPLIGFVFDETPVQNEISALSSVKSKYTAIGTGAVKDWEKMAEERDAEVKQAGQDKIREELVRQYNEWKKTQK